MKNETENKNWFITKGIPVGLLVVNGFLWLYSFTFNVPWYSVSGLIVLGALWVYLFSLCKIANHWGNDSHAQDGLAEMREELKKLERSLRIKTGRADYLETIIQSSFEPLFTCDAELRIFKFNQGAVKLFGLEQVDVLGIPVENLFTNGAQVIKLLEKVGKSKQKMVEEVRAIGVKNKKMILELSVSPLQMNEDHLDGYICSVTDITTRKRDELRYKAKATKAEKLARIDEMTGLFNRRQFEEDIVEFVNERKDIPDSKLSLVVMDLDKFKELNDTYGHQAGDEALRTFGEAVKRSIRMENDPGYRYGGDEFVIILPETDAEGAGVVTERIRKNYYAMRKGHNKTTISAGVATLGSQEDVSDLFARADERMYTAKKSGGDSTSY